MVANPRLSVTSPAARRPSSSSSPEPRICLSTAGSSTMDLRLEAHMRRRLQMPPSLEPGTASLGRLHRRPLSRSPEPVTGNNGCVEGVARNRLRPSSVPTSSPQSRSHLGSPQGTPTDTSSRHQLTGEFLKRVQRRLSVAAHPVDRNRPRSACAVADRMIASERFIQEARDLFARLDTNGDGMLDFSEVKGHLQKGRADLTERHLKNLFMGMDKDGNDRISFEEFVDFQFSSDLADSRHKLGRRTRHRRKFQQWSGPEVLFVNGSWDAETKRAMQHFLLAQQTPTARAAGERFVTGNWGSASTFALQEFLAAQQFPSAVKAGSTFATGVIDEATTRALHELLLEVEVPTATKIGPPLLEGTFGYSSVCALQEFLVLFRNANDARN
eukprot:TRINITY_DN43037_c0_g1_i1.p1 TRINITY_DN43037_c0_g1~~TRINITY_DN43037_c0_g1_i1.p1  ORF type:complete len:415 (-),score=65.51 TRINITY_DN43037_c0_g1_i1:37-1191(-)